jgi:hypothetical protein
VLAGWVVDLSFEEGGRVASTRQSLSLSVLMGVTMLLSAGSGTALATSFPWDIYHSTLSQNDYQHTYCWCVTSVAQDMLRYWGASPVPSQRAIDDYMKPINYNSWEDPNFSNFIKCKNGTSTPGVAPNYLAQNGTDYYDPSYANDSQGLAWAMYSWNGYGQGFDDYIFTGSSGQSNGNWNIVLNIRYTSSPVAVTVKHGKHEIMVVGFNTDFDPDGGAFGDNGNTILGFNVWDPFNGTGFTWTGWGPNGGNHGYLDNAYVTLATWNSFFTTDTHEGSGSGNPFNGNYVTVLPSRFNVSPGGVTGASYGAWNYQVNGHGSMATASSASLAAAPATAPSPTVAGAIAQGLSVNNLYDDKKLGSIPRNYSVGTSLHVTSVDPDQPSYEMVEIKSGTQPLAVAIVDDTSAGYLFGELLPVTPGSSLPTPAQTASTVRAAGLLGSGQYVYGPTDVGILPDTPFLVGTDGFGRPAFVSKQGITPLFTPTL